MAENLSMALAELLRKADAEPDVDTLCAGVRVMTQALMELEVAQHLGAERYQRTPERQGERNGYRDRLACLASESRSLGRELASGCYIGCVTEHMTRFASASGEEAEK